MSQPMSDTTLPAAGAGDGSAPSPAHAVITRLQALHDRTLRRHAPRLVPPSDVDDLIADTYLRVYVALRNGRGPTDDGLGYLIVTMRCAAIAQQRRRTRCPEVPLDDDLDLADHREPAASIDPQLIDALGDLTAHQRQVLWATAVEGHTPRDLVGSLGSSPAAIATASYRARKSLRSAFLDRSQALEHVGRDRPT